jgi:broad specificity phosphatase PhoE
LPELPETGKVSAIVIPTIYIIRHATPDWSRTDLVYHLPPGPPLTAQGEAEAAKLGDFLRDMGVGHIFTSPLARCLRTAEIAAMPAGLTPVEDTRLAEWRPDERAPDVRARLWPAWVHAGELCLNTGAVALVTHGGPIGLLLTELGLDHKLLAHYQSTFDRRNPAPPAGAWRAVRTSPDAPWALELAFTPEAHQARAWFV